MDHAVARARDLFAQLDADAAATPAGAPVPQSSVDAIIEAGVHAVSVPREVGGLELPLSEAIDVWAELSRADGSTGWCAFAADITAAYFGAYLPDDGAATVFADGVPVMAGQFAPNGTATIDGTDLVVNGDYQFGSGLAHASWVGAGVLAGPDAAEYLFTCFPAEQAELRGNWDVLGLQATASYDYGVRDVRVPRSHSFDFFAPKVHRGGPMYALGVLPITAAGHSGWALGVTRRALDELAALATDTTRMGASSSLAESERFLHEYGNLESRYLAGRAWIHELLVGAEAQAARDGGIDVTTANLIRQACVHITRGGADIAREAYLLAGTRALRDGPLQRAFRDLHAGSQHFFASPASTIDLARTLLTS